MPLNFPHRSAVGLLAVQAVPVLMLYALALYFQAATASLSNTYQPGIELLQAVISPSGLLLLVCTAHRQISILAFQRWQIGQAGVQRRAAEGQPVRHRHRTDRGSGGNEPPGVERHPVRPVRRKPAIDAPPRIPSAPMRSRSSPPSPHRFTAPGWRTTPPDCTDCHRTG